MRNDEAPWEPSDLKAAMAEAWQNGFVVGLTELLNSGPESRIENTAIRQFCLELNTLVPTDDPTIERSAATLDDGSIISRPINPAAELYS